MSTTKKADASIFFEHNTLAIELTKLPEPYRSWTGASIEPETCCVYNDTKPKSSLLLGSVVAALLDYCSVDPNIGAVKIQPGMYATQWTQPDRTVILALVDSKGNLKAAVRQPSGKHDPMPGFSKYTEYPVSLSSIFLAFILSHADGDSYGSEQLRKALDLCKATYEVSGVMDETSVRLISDTVHQGLMTGNIPCVIPSRAIDMLTKTKVDSGSCKGTVVSGDPYILQPDSGTSKLTGYVTFAEASAKFRSYADTRKWSPEEEAMIPKFPPESLVRTEVIKLARRFIAGLGTEVPNNQVLWRGISGIGKTYSLRQLAAILHTPLVVHTCSSGTEKLDFMSSYVPVGEKDAGAVSASLPSMTALYADPESAYKRITGIEKEDATEDDALAAYAEKYAENKGGSPFKFVSSDYVTGLSRGYIVEVSEASRAKAGEIVGLNNYDRPGSPIHLANGETVYRDPNAFVIFTDNTDCISVRPMDESVRRRFAYIITTDKLTKEDMIARVKNTTHCTDDSLLDNMYGVWSDIVDYCKNHDIDTCIVSITEYEAWVAAVMREGISTLEDTLSDYVISKCGDPDVCEEVMENCAKISIDKHFQ